MAETLKEILNSLRDKARGEPICKVSEGEMQYFGALRSSYEANHLITLDSLTPAQQHADELGEALGKAVELIESTVEYQHSGDPYEENTFDMGELPIHDFHRDGGLEALNILLAKIKGDE